MSTIEIIIAVGCDYPGCRERTGQISDDFVAVPLAPGWERWRGRRRTFDYCPEHAARPKSPNMHRVQPPGGAAPSGEQRQEDGQR